MPVTLADREEPRQLIPCMRSFWLEIARALLGVAGKQRREPRDDINKRFGVADGHREGMWAQRAATETVYKFLERAERLSREVAVEFADLLGHVARVEYGVLRSIVRGAVDVDVNVGVNVGVLPKGMHVDVLSGGVNVDVLSREAT